MRPSAAPSSARLGRQIGRDLTLCVADLGWSIHLPDDADFSLSPESIRSLLALEGFADDVLEGLDRGELLARRFQHVAATALMVLRNPEPGRRVRVGGLNWVSTRLYPMVKSACPDHPLLRETRREVLEDILDVPAAITLACEAAARSDSASSPSSRRSPPPGSNPAGPISSASNRPRTPSAACTPVWLSGCARNAGMKRANTVERTHVFPSVEGWQFTPEGAAVHHGERTAVIADVHLGYEWARGAAGDCVVAHSLARNTRLAFDLARPIARCHA